MIKEFKEFIKLAKRFRELDLDELKRFCHLQIEIENALGRLENYEKNEDFSKDVLNYAFLTEQDKVKKLKALEIIKKKEVNVFIFLHSSDLETYNDIVEDDRKLTQEEYDLLKEVLL